MDNEEKRQADDINRGKTPDKSKKRNKGDEEMNVDEERRRQEEKDSGSEREDIERDD